MNNAPIGVFDSGMGGLTVMRSLMQRLPRESFVYLGDTARLPYGTKSAETITHYAVQAAGALMKRNVKLLVVACNTASAVALPSLQKTFAPVATVGVIEPGADAAVQACADGIIAVLATEGTVRGGAYQRAIKTRSWRASVIQQACPLFVSIAEEGITDGPIAAAVAHRYLDPIFSPPIYIDPLDLKQVHVPDCVVLGCTHFPILRRTIEGIIGPKVRIVDSADTTADAVAQLLSQNDLAAAHPIAPHRFLVTDSPERFASVGEIFLGKPIDLDAIELIDLQ